MDEFLRTTLSEHTEHSALLPFIIMLYLPVHYSSEPLLLCPSPQCSFLAGENDAVAKSGITEYKYFQKNSKSIYERGVNSRHELTEKAKQNEILLQTAQRMLSIFYLNILFH
jgi:hypothetical protein